MGDESDDLKQIIQKLSNAVVVETSNWDTNKKLWDNYASNWTKDSDWVIKMVENLNDYDHSQTNVHEYLDNLGDEWSDKRSLNGVLNDFIYPYLNENSVVGEIGSGGGRITTKLASKAKEITCFDISKNMLDICKKNLTRINPNIQSNFVLIQEPDFPHPYNSEYFDFLCIFDVFPHVDLHTQWKYIKKLSYYLKENGHALIHTANLESTLGWSRFSNQSKFTAGGFYFVVPSMIRMLIKKANLSIVSESSPEKDIDNMYYNRDYIVIVKKVDKIVN